MGPPGHFAMGLAAKTVAPKAPLWVLLLATEILDVLCYSFQAIGIEDFGASHTDIHQGVEVLRPAPIRYE